MSNSPLSPDNRPQSREDLIAALTDDITPVRRVQSRDGVMAITFGAVIAGLACILIFGFWTGMLVGEASAFFWITNGLLAITGAATTAAVAGMGIPRVGMRASAPYWSAMMLAVLPLTALITYFSIEASHNHGSDLLNPSFTDWKCAGCSVIAAMLVIASSVFYLRRSAPVSIEKAAWLTGIAAGALGALAYGLTCPMDDILHLGIYHVLPVGIAALIGRALVPSLIRW